MTEATPKAKTTKAKPRAKKATTAKATAKTTATKSAPKNDPKSTFEAASGDRKSTRLNSSH